MKTQNTRKIILMSLIAFFILGLSSSRLIEDAISCTDNAYWENSNCSKFTVTFSERTKDSKHVDITIHTSKDLGNCTWNSNYSLENSTTYKLSRSLHSGEYVEIYWWGSFHRKTLYGKD